MSDYLRYDLKTVKMQVRVPMMATALNNVVLLMGEVISSFMMLPVHVLNITGNKNVVNMLLDNAISLLHLKLQQILIL